MKKRALAGALALSVIASAAPAAAEFKLNYDDSANEYVVTGKMPSSTRGQTVTVTVKDKSDALLYARQITTDINGEYRTSFGLTATDEATLKVSEAGAVTSRAIYKASPDELTGSDGALTRFNSQEDEDTVITSEYKALLVDLAEFNSYKTGTPLLEYLKGKTAATLGDFLKIYNKGIFLAELSRGTSTDLSVKMADCGILNSTKNSAAIFNGYEEAEKNQILAALAGKAFTSDVLFENALCETVILNELSKASTVDQKYAVIEKNNDVLGLALSSYSALGESFDNFKAQAIGLPYASVSDLKDNFTNTYSGFVSGGGTSSRPQHSGGGGSGSSSVKVDSSLITAPVTNAENTYFGDLAGFDWAKDAITSLAQRNVISGKGNGIFAPGDTVTRAEFTKMAVNAFGMYNSAAAVDFDDVKADSWEYPYVASAVEKNIINGVGGNLFDGSSFITRQDLAVICYRVLKTINSSEIDLSKGTEFADLNDVSEYAAEAVAALSGAGIINGKGNNMFCPKDNATRAEAAKIIYSMLGGK